MPFQMDIIENGQNGLPNTGVPHPESYWEIDQFTVQMFHGGSDTAGTIVEFHGWHDKAAHDAGDNAFFKKLYELPPSAIDFTPTVGDAIAGLYVMVQYIPEPDSGVSFFDGASVV